MKAVFVLAAVAAFCSSTSVFAASVPLQSLTLVAENQHVSSDSVDADTQCYYIYQTTTTTRGRGRRGRDAEVGRFSQLPQPHFAIAQ